MVKLKLADIYTLCSEKKHPLTFSFIYPCVMCTLNKNCSECTQGAVDSDNVKLFIHCGRWRHYDVTFV